jgi:DNA-binding PadR family transcriptional regulator
MATKKRPSNLLALAVLSLLTERPMHPYEMSVMMRHRGHSENIKSSRGSIYTVVESLERDGFVEAQETSREGKRPERTVYSITAPGSELFHHWLRELLANPSKEYSQFAAALMLVAHLNKGEIIEILEDRVGQLSEQLKADIRVRKQIVGMIPRVFMIENEYDEAIRAAQVAWLRKTIAEIKSGGYPWPAIIDGRLAWDGDETFQAPDLSLVERGEWFKTKEAEGRATREKEADK